MLKKFAFALSFLMVGSLVFAQKLTIDGNKFKREGKTIFLSGLNTPWQNDANFRIDFLGTSHFDSNYWTTQFLNMKNNNVNSVRIWVHGRGNNTPAYDNNGFTLSPSQEFYDDLDFVLDLATQHKIYVILNMWSFDMVLKSGSGQPGSTQFRAHRNTILDNNKTVSYLNNFLTPVIRRYVNNPYLLAYEVMNEPEAVWENSNNLVDGAINRNQMIAFVAKFAAKVHEVSNKKNFVTVGSKWIIYNSSNFNNYGGQISPGDNYSNASLRAQFNDSNAYLDFYSMHWYQWQSTGSPFNRTVSSLYPRVSKPVLVAEYPGIDLPNNDCGCTCSTPRICDFNKSIVQAYKDIENNDFAGITAWRNGQEDDRFGTSAKIYEATRAFANSNPELVSPSPDAHSGLKITNFTANGFTLSWNPNENALNGTNIFIIDENNNTGEVFVGTAQKGETSFQLSGSYGSVNITSGGTYTLKVQALPDANNNAFSQISTSYDESFENTLGSWTQATNDDLNWSIKSNGTPSNTTGPDGATDGSFYIFVEASGDGTGYPNKRAILESPDYAINTTNNSFTFKYHMNGSNDFGTINLEISENNGANWRSIWNASGNKGNTWLVANVNLSAYIDSTIKLRFNRVTGGTWQADLALDDIKFIETNITPTEGCSNGISSFPYTESFESNIGAWTQNSNDDLDWIINSSGTPSGNTGPSSASSGNSYLYVEASGNGSGYPDKRAIIESPCFDLQDKTKANFTFKYHMFGANDFGKIDLEISTDNGSSWKSIWSLSGNKGNAWLEADINLETYLEKSIKLRFNRLTGSTWQADFALDDVNLIDDDIIVTPPSGCQNGISKFPYGQNFENNLGGWIQDANDDLNWTRDDSGTPSNGTGPSNAAEGNDYLFVEASGNGTGYPNKSAIIISPCFDLTTANSASFSFSYHMYGATDFGSITLEASNDNGATWVNLWNSSGNKGNQWLSQSIDLSNYIGSGLKLRFNRVTASTWQADFALDNVRLTTANTLATKSENLVVLEVAKSDHLRKLYPNPVNGSTIYITTEYDNLDYVIYNINGQKIANGKLQNKSIDVSSLRSSVYILEFINDQDSIIKRFIKN